MCRHPWRQEHLEPLRRVLNHPSNKTWSRCFRCFFFYFYYGRFYSSREWREREKACARMRGTERERGRERERQRRGGVEFFFPLQMERGSLKKKKSPRAGHTLSLEFFTPSFPPARGPEQSSLASSIATEARDLLSSRQRTTDGGLRLRAELSPAGGQRNREEDQYKLMSSTPAAAAAATTTTTMPPSSSSSSAAPPLANGSSQLHPELQRPAQPVRGFADLWRLCFFKERKRKRRRRRRLEWGAVDVRRPGDLFFSVAHPFFRLLPPTTPQ